MSNMQMLYTQMKAALEYFGVKFFDMERVEFHIEANKIIFTHGDAQLSIEVQRAKGSSAP